MRIWLVAPLLLTVTTSAGPHRPPADFSAAAIRAWHANEELVRVELRSIGGHRFVALCDSLHSWWGFFGVYEILNGTVLWQAEVPDEPTEQSILSARSVAIPGLVDPIIEVYGQTHRGNGGLHLYALRERTLHLLLETPAVDFHDDGFVLEGGRLAAEYADVNGDGFGDVSLSGRVQEFDLADEKTIIRSWPCERCFVWNPTKRLFEADPERSVGEFPVP